MKVVRVIYTVKPEFAAQNAKNIQAVMEELRALGRKDIKYAAYLQEDGKTFMHLSHHLTKESDAFPTSLQAFKKFQEEVKQNVVEGPKRNELQVAHASFDLFP